MLKINKIKESIIEGTNNLVNRIKYLENQLKEKEIENEILKNQVENNNTELNELNNFIKLQFSNNISSSPKELSFNLTFPTQTNTLCIKSFLNELPKQSKMTEIDYNIDNIPTLVLEPLLEPQLEPLLEPQDQELTMLKKILIQNFGNNITSPLITSNKGPKK